MVKKLSYPSYWFLIEFFFISVQKKSAKGLSVHWSIDIIKWNQFFLKVRNRYLEKSQISTKVHFLECTWKLKLEWVFFETNLLQVISTGYVINMEDLSIFLENSLRVLTVRIFSPWPLNHPVLPTESMQIGKRHNGQWSILLMHSQIYDYAATV